MQHALASQPSARRNARCRQAPCRRPQRRSSAHSHHPGGMEQADGIGAATTAPPERPAAGLRQPSSGRGIPCRSPTGIRAPFRIGMRTGSGADHVVVSSTLVTQSRSASFIASFSVPCPEDTGRTSAPSSFMRKTFGAWRSTSVAPCKRCRAGRSGPQPWPRLRRAAGTGFGDDPGLAHPLGQQDLAEAIVDLVRAGMVELIALEIDLGAAQFGRQPLSEIERARAPV